MAHRADEAKGVIRERVAPFAFVGGHSNPWRTGVEHRTFVSGIAFPESKYAGKLRIYNWSRIGRVVLPTKQGKGST